MIATWYGPGFYNHRFACANTPGLPDNYGQQVRGVAHRTLPCGTRLTIRWRKPGASFYRSAKVRVIDRGPYSGATFDLTARTAMDLICGTRHECDPFTLGTGGKPGVTYHRGW